MPICGLLQVELTPVRTIFFHLIRKLRLRPERNNRTHTKANHERFVSHMTNLMQHEGNPFQLAPGGRAGGAGVLGSDASLFAAGRPKVFGFFHAVAEVRVDFGNFSSGYHAGRVSERRAAEESGTA